MANTSDSCPVSPCTILSKLGLTPSGNGKVSKAIITCGGISYVALAVNMFNPRLIDKLPLNRDLTNTILACTVAGGTCYLYQKPHLASLKNSQQRIFLSAYGATMVSLGSLLLWAMGKALLPESNSLRLAVAVGSSIALLRTGSSYVAVIEGASKNSSK